MRNTEERPLVFLYMDLIQPKTVDNSNKPYKWQSSDYKFVSRFEHCTYLTSN